MQFKDDAQRERFQRELGDAILADPQIKHYMHLKRRFINGAGVGLKNIVNPDHNDSIHYVVHVYSPKKHVKSNADALRNGISFTSAEFGKVTVPVAVVENERFVAQSR